jgi:ketosteroid isomerase-like protein
VAHSREEVEAEFNKYRARGDAKDWNAWADQFTEDALYIEHEMGTFHGREEIRKWIVETMAPVIDMHFPTEWFVIDGDMVVFAAWNALPHPKGTGDDFKFLTVSVLHYAGDGLWSYEEDIYNPKEAERAIAAYMAAAAAT